MSWFWILGVFTSEVRVDGENGSQNIAMAFLYFAKNGDYFNRIPYQHYVLFTSLFLFGIASAILFVSLFIDKIGIKKTVNSFASVFLIGLIGLLLSFGHFNLAVIFAFLTGIGSGIVVVPFMKLSTQWFKPNKISFPIGIYISIGLCGGVLSNFLFVPLSHINISFLQHYSMFKSFVNSKSNGGVPILISIIIVLLFWILSFFIIEKDKLIHKYYSGIYHYGSDIVKVLKKKQNIAIPIIMSFMNLPISVITWSLHSLLFNYYNFNLPSPQTLDAIISLLLIGDIVGSFIIPYIADLLGKRKIIFIITNALLILFTFLLIIKSLSVLSLFFIFFIIGFWCSAQKIGYPMLIEQNKRDYVAPISSWCSMILISNGIIIQNLFTTVYNFYNNHHIDNNHSSVIHLFVITPWMIALIPTTMVFSLFISFFIIETGPKVKNKKLLKLLISDYSFKEKYFSFQNFKSI